MNNDNTRWRKEKAEFVLAICRRPAINKTGWLVCLVLGLTILCGRSSPACTMVMAAKNGQVLVGNNEDWGNPHTRITFVPAELGRYGCVYFGFDDGFPQGGMNDQGLFIDGNAVKSTGWQAEPGKPLYFGHLMLGILGECRTVAEVEAWFNKYNIPALNRARFPVADRSGASMVVEYAQGKVRFVKEKTWYQVSTNFLRTDHPGDEVPCNRFRLANQIMGAAVKLDLPLIRAVLSAAHQEGDYPTLYSNIFDLKAGIVTVYHFHNFEEAVVLRLADELKKGKRPVDLPSLFRVQPHAARVFADQQTQPSYPILLDVYNQDGGTAALARYEEMRRNVRWISRYDIGGDQILRLADLLLSKGDAATALGFFTGLSRSFPDSWQPFEGIGRAQLALGKKDEAIAAFRRALEINPGNQGVTETLGKLEKEE